MSNVPRYLFTGRVKNQLYGDMTLVDGLFGALTDAHVGGGELMGLLTERLVEKYGVTREEQDEVAFRSHHAALAAWEGAPSPTTWSRSRCRSAAAIRSSSPATRARSR